MKRLLLPMLVVALLVSLGATNFTAQEQQVITIGLITYQYEATAWPLENLIPILERDMELLPPPDTSNRGTSLEQKLRSDPPVKFVTKVAATAADQVAAIEEFVAQGVRGLMIVPVADTTPILQALETALLQRIPVVVLHRPIPGLSGRLTAYVGLEPFAVGVGWARGATERNRVFMAVASDLNDPLQSELTRGLAAKAGDLYKGTVEATLDTVFDKVSAVVQQTDPLINYLIVADPALIPETIRAVSSVTAGGDRLVKVGSFRVPDGARALMASKVMHFVTTQDTYNMFQAAALELKMFNVTADPLDTIYVDAQVWGGLSAQMYMSYPYDYYNQIQFTFNRFWS